MCKQKIKAILNLIFMLHINFLQGLELILFRDYYTENVWMDIKKVKKPKPDKEKFDKFMKRVTK